MEEKRDIGLLNLNLSHLLENDSVRGLIFLCPPKLIFNLKISGGWKSTADSLTFYVSKKNASHEQPVPNVKTLPSWEFKKWKDDSFLLKFKNVSGVLSRVHPKNGVRAVKREVA